MAKLTVISATETSLIGLSKSLPAKELIRPELVGHRVNVLRAQLPARAYRLGLGPFQLSCAEFNLSPLGSL